MIHLKKILVTAILSILFLCFIKCTGYDKPNSNDPRGSQFAGSATCASCHMEIAGSYIHNSHFSTSARADYNYLQNTLNIPVGDTVSFTNDQHVILNRQGSEVRQTSYKDGQLVKSQKIDLAFGSAEKAQTYGYWKDNQLYELPLTWLSSSKIWTNSPGFPVDHPYFTRIIPSRCFECHTSYVRTEKKREVSQLQLKEIYDSSTIIYGIDCERCHGPAAQHVAFQRQRPDVKQAKFITSFKSLSRQQQLDMCGTCHAGDPVRLKSIFNFFPGDSLSKYYLYYNGASGEPDVHGMQLQLLRSSKCFQKTEMTCITCHSPHQSKDNQQSIVSTCISCHQRVEHTTDIQAEKGNCITCHMPSRPSKSLDFKNTIGTNNLQYMLRTHRIAVYPKNEWQ